MAAPTDSSSFRQLVRLVRARVASFFARASVACSRSNSQSSVRLDHRRQLFNRKFCSNRKMGKLPLVDRFIENLKNVDEAKTNEILNTTDIGKLLTIAEKIFEPEPTLVETDGPILIGGDLHGQYKDFVSVFDTHGWPPKCRYLFLGDYVDRGEHSIETIVLLLALKVKFPQDVILLRGNHETREMNRWYGFKEELEKRLPIDPKQKVPLDLYERFNAVFDHMPLAASIGGRILCMHGGISPELKSLHDIASLKKPMRSLTKGLATDLLWSDPKFGVSGFVASERGVSFNFGEDAVVEACERLGIDMIVRAHQMMEYGYHYFARRHLVTVFTAPDYFGGDNHGALLEVDDKLNVEVVVSGGRLRWQHGFDRVVNCGSSSF